MGALVTSNEAGLAVPDWPTSFGENMFLFPPSKWQGIIFFEHVHRLIASFVGLLTVILAVWIYRKETRPWVRIASYLAVLAVILQGTLGGLTVLYQLPLAISSLHGVLGQSFFILMIVLAYSQSAELEERARSGKLPGDRRIFKFSSIFLAIVFAQLVIGALMRHSEAGIAVPDFPLMGGKVVPQLNQAEMQHLNDMRASLHLPPVDKAQVAVHLLHRFWAVVVLLSCCLLVAKASKQSSTLKIWTYLVGYIVIVQFALGIFSLLTVRQPVVTSLHVLLGALLLGASALLCLKAYPLKSSAAIS